MKQVARESRRDDNSEVTREFVSRGQWAMLARTPLYRAKRAEAFASILEIELAYRGLHERLSETPDALFRLGRSIEHSALSKLARRVRSLILTSNVADISVCGAIDPYRAILGGKLVSLLAASPAAVDSFTRTYEDHPSVIASGMAGQATTRPTNPLFLTTTSLYQVGASQYKALVHESRRLEALRGPGPVGARWATISA
jgi:hypothetical protein